MRLLFNLLRICLTTMGLLAFCFMSFYLATIGRSNIMTLSIKNLTKFLGNKAVDNISLDIESGEFIAFIGTSGSGKTTALRMINRMIEATDGTIEMNGKNEIEITNPAVIQQRIDASYDH